MDLQDSGSSPHVLKAMLADPADHPHLSIIPLDESGVLNIDGEEVPTWRWAPPTRGSDRVDCRHSQRLVPDLDRAPT